jgi:myo-inositol-1(or 4)-monophosphatase
MMPAVDPAPASLEAAAVEIARGAANILLDYYRRALAVDYKDAGQSDPVTAADRDAEAYVAREVKARFPDHAIIGEEGSPGDPNARYLWIVDPVDGTANFINHLPVFAVSIGVLRDGQPIAGAIFIPGPLELGGGVYHAHLGGGAFIDDRPIHAAAAAEPHPSGLVSLPVSWARRYEFTGELAKHSGYQRTLGSAAAELAFAASGVLQYGLFGSLRIWDVAAGLIIVREAGGEVYERSGDGWAPFAEFRRGTPTETDPTGLKGWSELLLFGGREIVSFVSARVRILGGAPDA